MPTGSLRSRASSLWAMQVNLLIAQLNNLLIVRRYAVYLAASSAARSLARDPVRMLNIA